MKLSSRHKEILDVSLSIISKKGVQNFTMRQIAQHIGVSEPAIYRHFPNKIAILEALVDDLGEYHRELAQKYLLNGDLEEIRRFVLEIIRNLTRKPALSSVIFSEEIFRNEPSLALKVKEFMYGTEQTMTGQLSQSSLSRTLPAQHICWMLLGAIRFLVTRWRLSEFSFDLEAEGEAFLDNLWKLPVVQNDTGNPQQSR